MLYMPILLCYDDMNSCCQSVDCVIDPASANSKLLRQKEQCIYIILLT